MSKYVKCAEEMNKVMGLDPAIDTEAKEKELKEAIKSNAEEVVVTDKFTNETWEVIEELTEKEVQRPPSAEKKSAKKVANPDAKIDPNPAVVKPAKKVSKKKEEAEEDDNKDADDSDDGTEEADEKDDSKDLAKEKAVAKKKEASCKIRRELTVYEAVKQSSKPLTWEALVKTADNVYLTSGGKGNLKQSEHVCVIIMKVLIHCGAVKEDGGKYSL